MGGGGKVGARLGCVGGGGGGGEEYCDGGTCHGL